MKIGYPCINRSIGCRGNKTFRLKSYSEKRLIETVEKNLKCLNKILDYNIKNTFLFFRISSDLVPFASHPICKYNWQDHFKYELEKIGKKIKKNKIRISMHPDQFIVLNSTKKDVVKRSIAELIYHKDILDLMKLDKTAKIQLHVGGAYGHKEESIDRFINNYGALDKKIKNRLVIENDDKIYSFKDCFYIFKKTNIPILFDVFHHKVLNNSESINEILEKQNITWDKKDGIPLIDYSSQKIGFRSGSHTESINMNDFKGFLKESEPYDFDIMLEIKDKEISALKSLKILKEDKRFYKRNKNKEKKIWKKQLLQQDVFGVLKRNLEK